MFGDAESVNAFSLKPAEVYHAHLGLRWGEEFDEQTQVGSVIDGEPGVDDVLWLDHRHSEEVLAHLDTPDQQLGILLLEAFFEDGDHSILPLEELELEGVGEVQLRLLVLVETLVSLPLVTILGELTFVRCSVVTQNHGQ